MPDSDGNLAVKPGLPLVGGVFEHEDASGAIIPGTILGGSLWLRRDGLQTRIRWNLWFRTNMPHSRGRSGAWEGGTNLDRGMLQP